MTRSLWFLPEVEEDAINGFLWYEGRSSGLGEEFLRIFYAGAHEILWNPLLYPKVHGDFRRRLLRRFPYAQYFLVRDADVIVIGLFHCARSPGRIKSSLRARRMKK